MSEPTTTSAEPGNRRPWQVSRRFVLKAGLGGAAAIGASAALARRAEARNQTDTIRTLVERTSNGFNLEEYQRAKRMGYKAYLEYQLDHLNIDDSATDALLATNHPTLKMSPFQVANYYNGGSKRGEVNSQMVEGTVVRRVHSKRQLFERMVEFWTDHFNIDMANGSVLTLIQSWDRDVIRKHALGNFGQLLNATARSAAMSDYLDNYANIKTQPQENYARELLELHTMGADRGYTQTDVQEVARCLTGWNYHYLGAGVLYGTFRFISNQHDYGAKRVLGRTFPANQPSTSDGDELLAMLIEHQRTATYIAEEMAKFFLGYSPAKWVVQAVANTYTGTRGDIKSMLRVLLDESVVRQEATPKFKRPVHFATSLLRATKGWTIAKGGPTNHVGVSTDALGQWPHRWPTPDGFPDSVEAWAQSLLPRWTFATDLAENNVPWARFNPVTALDQVGFGLHMDDLGSAIDTILGGPLTAAETSKLQQSFVGVNPQTLRDAICIAASMPGFQWY